MRKWLPALLKVRHLCDELFEKEANAVCALFISRLSPLWILSMYAWRVSCIGHHLEARLFIALCSQSDPQYSKFQQLIHQQDQVQLALPLCLRYLKRYIYICLNVCFSNGRSRLWKLCLRWWSPSRLKCSASGKVAQSHVIDCAACQFLFPLGLFTFVFFKFLVLSSRISLFCWLNLKN